MSYDYPPRQSVQLVAPAIEPLTLAETKLFLRVDSSIEDTLIIQLTTAARELVEQYLGKVLITQSWQMTQAYVPGQMIPIRPGPIRTITSVKTLLNTQETLLSTDQYKVSISGCAIELNQPVNADTVIIEYEAGFGTAEQVPAAIKQAILHMVSHLYHHREEPRQLQENAMELLDAFMEIRL
jgi:uncharacterized phiE125 gp8 family phage protein